MLFAHKKTARFEIIPKRAASAGHSKLKYFILIKGRACPFAVETVQY
jgi:hypothetical protein